MSDRNPSAKLRGRRRAALLDVVTQAAPEFPPGVFTLIALFGVGNTALLNFVTASRLLGGMSRQILILGWFGLLLVLRGKRTNDDSPRSAV